MPCHERSGRSGTRGGGRPAARRAGWCRRRRRPGRHGEGRQARHAAIVLLPRQAHHREPREPRTGRYAGSGAGAPCASCLPCGTCGRARGREEADEDDDGRGPGGHPLLAWTIASAAAPKTSGLPARPAMAMPALPWTASAIWSPAPPGRGRARLARAVEPRTPMSRPPRTATPRAEPSWRTEPAGPRPWPLSRTGTSERMTLVSWGGRHTDAEAVDEEPCGDEQARDGPAQREGEPADGHRPREEQPDPDHGPLADPRVIWRQCPRR